MIPWIKCKIIGHNLRVVTIAENCVVNGDNEDCYYYVTNVVKICKRCKNFANTSFQGLLAEKEKVDLVETFEDNS